MPQRHEPLPRNNYSKHWSIQEISLKNSCPTPAVPPPPTIPNSYGSGLKHNLILHGALLKDFNHILSCPLKMTLWRELSVSCDLPTTVLKVKLMGLWNLLLFIYNRLLTSFFLSLLLLCLWVYDPYLQSWFWSVRKTCLQRWKGNEKYTMVVKLH